MDRRTTIKWVLAAGAVWPLRFGAAARACGAEAAPSGTGAGRAPVGYGTDPDLITTHHRGEFWPLTLSEPQRTLAGTLCDLIIPADEHSPAASAVGVVDFIDEWISAPYPDYQADRQLVLEGFAWLDAEARQRGGRPFAQLPVGEQHAICDEICDVARASPARASAARFFAHYRNLTAGGFYSTPVGRKDVGYVGNVAQAAFAPAPRELLEKLKLT